MDIVPKPFSYFLESPRAASRLWTQKKEIRAIAEIIGNVHRKKRLTVCSEWNPKINEEILK